MKVQIGENIIYKPNIKSFDDVLRIVESRGPEYKERFEMQMIEFNKSLNLYNKWKNMVKSGNLYLMDWGSLGLDYHYDLMGNIIYDEPYLKIPDIMSELLSYHTVLSSGRITIGTEKDTTHLSTLNFARDILIGRNVFNEEGKLIRKDRGYPLGNIVVLSGQKGTGKSTEVEQDLGDIILRYPLFKIGIFDSDNSYDLSRFSKVSGVNLSQLEKVVEVFKPSDDLNLSFMEKKIADYQKEYEKTAKPVEYDCPLTGKKKTMMPPLIIVEDSISSVITEGNTISEKSEAGNEAFMQAYNKLSAHAVRCLGLCGGNALIIMVAHRKVNTAPIGQTQATKEFKTSTNAYKNVMPEKIRQLAAYVIEIDKSISTNNIESDSHPAKIYDLVREGVNFCYINQNQLGKSRSGPENVDKWSNVYVTEKFDRALSMLDTAINNGTFIKDGLYPTSDDKNIFNVNPRSKKTCYTIEGFNYEDGTPVRFDIRTAKYALRCALDPLYASKILATEEQLEFSAKLFTAIFKTWETKIYKDRLNINRITPEEVKSKKEGLTNLSKLLIGASSEIDENIY